LQRLRLIAYWGLRSVGAYCSLADGAANGGGEFLVCAVSVQFAAVE
jgi:hypothetical protein